MDTLTHDQLIKLAVQHLRDQHNCTWILTDCRRKRGAELPDALAILGNHLLNIECKASRSDFLRDSDKNRLGIGTLRVYVTNPGVLRPDELPLQWGHWQAVIDGSERPYLEERRSPAAADMPRLAWIEVLKLLKADERQQAVKADGQWSDVERLLRATTEPLTIKEIASALEWPKGRTKEFQRLAGRRELPEGIDIDHRATPWSFSCTGVAV